MKSTIVFQNGPLSATVTVGDFESTREVFEAGASAFNTAVSHVQREQRHTDDNRAENERGNYDYRVATLDAAIERANAAREALENRMVMGAELGQALDEATVNGVMTALVVATSISAAKDAANSAYAASRRLNEAKNGKDGKRGLFGRG